MRNQESAKAKQFKLHLLLVPEEEEREHANSSTQQLMQSSFLLICTILHYNDKNNLDADIYQ